jgi:hypothetical protein
MKKAGYLLEEIPWQHGNPGANIIIEPQDIAKLDPVSHHKCRGCSGQSCRIYIVSSKLKTFTFCWNTFSRAL